MGAAPRNLLNPRRTVARHDREEEDVTVNVTVADESPRNERAGQTSYLLLAPGQFDSAHMAITLVEGGPGSEQPIHSHPEAEQVYVIVAGNGIMRVDDDEQEVGPGTLVFIPPGASHAIRNVGSTSLTYVSATSPPFLMPEPGSVFAYAPPDGGGTE